jgi:hypothetical protein
VDSTLISFLEIFEGFPPFSVFLLSGHLESKPLRMSHHFFGRFILADDTIRWKRTFAKNK